MWDVVFYDIETGIAYRIQAKRLSMRDGAAVDDAQDKITQRFDGRELLMMRRYPVLLYGTKEAQIVHLDSEPPYANDIPQINDDAAWTSLELTEDVYGDLSELAGLLWYGAIIDKNPHRDLGYQVLKKNMMVALQPTTNDISTNSSASSEKPPGAG